MLRKLISCIILGCFFGLSSVSAQEFNVEQLSSINIDNLSTEQIRSFWEKAQNQGYSLSDLENLAKLKGVSPLQISKLRQRILTLPAKQNNKRNNADAEDKNERKNKVEIDTFGITNRQNIKELEHKKSKVWGFDFFQNPKISFTPNVNMPTPENYIIGTDDELLIDVWGAAENSFSQKVDNQGNINLNMVGKIRVGGLSFTEAKARINSALRQIYSGISAPDGSYNKVYTSVSIANVRTVKVNIIGEVQVPGTYSLSALSTVLNALYASGGPTETGSFRDIQLIRNGKKIASFDVYDFLLKGSQEGNLSLNDQDVIIIPPYKNQVEVTGKVKREGLYEIKDNETLVNLIDFFGGFTPNAYKDNLVIERIVGAKREVKEVPYNQANTFIMKSGDKLTVQQLSDIYHNKISIGGAVYQPGNYAYTEGMTALDLINRAAGVLDEAYLERGLLFRTTNRVDKQTLNFSIKDLLTKKEYLPLQANDSIFIFNRDSLINKQFVRIEGAVKKPQNIPFMEGLKAEDLIIMAGGFIEGADSSIIHLSRQKNDENFKTISETQDISLSPDLKISSGSVALQPNDIVTVRFQKGYAPQQIIKIEGEIIYPGHYSILTKEERISDFIERAGGLTPYAYLKGATLIRKITDLSDKEQNKQIKELDNVTDEIKIVKVGDQEEFRVGINLEKIMKNKNAYQNLILKDGDVIIIPSEKQTVEVKGLVLAPSLVQYEKGKNLKSYVNNAGGFSNNARKSGAYVVYANGSVEGTRKFLFFKSYPKIEPGAIIIVPEKPERKSLSTSETISITTALTTLMILIYNTFK
ncbi:MAG: SLBB domain-containing protein [Capnocytophaga sp.]|nr:SLBB domain-containing protein [Capnocytophaga sp.]